MMCVNCGRPISRHPSGWFHSETGLVRFPMEFFAIPAEGEDQDGRVQYARGVAVG